MSQYEVKAKQVRSNWIVRNPQMYRNNFFKVNQQKILTFCSQKAKVNSRNKCICWKTFFLFLNIIYIYGLTEILHYLWENHVQVTFSFLWVFLLFLLLLFFILWKQKFKRVTNKKSSGILNCIKEKTQVNQSEGRIKNRHRKKSLL